MATIQMLDIDEFPICPHCLKELQAIGKHEIGTLSMHIIYFCPYCKKVLNIVSEKYGY